LGVSHSEACILLDGGEEGREGRGEKIKFSSVQGDITPQDSIQGIVTYVLPVEVFVIGSKWNQTTQED